MRGLLQMYDFDFVKAVSIEGAVKLLKNDGAQIIAGGQTLVPTLKQRLASPGILISLTGVNDLIGVYKTTSNEICVGAATTHEQVNREALDYPALSNLAGKIGDPAVRYRGTIGGSLANNDPSACYPAAVLGSGATIVTDIREILADDFFLGMFETKLADDEVITKVKFPIPIHANYQKFDQPASRFALVAVFVAKFDFGVRVAVTGASINGVFRWEQAETQLSFEYDGENLDDVGLSHDDFITDMHGSAEYRANLVRVLTKRAVVASHY